MLVIFQAAILCGGLGSRLGELAAKTPKPLLPVDGVPFLDVLLFELGRHGVKRVLLLAGFAAHRIIDYASSTPMKVRFGLDIEVSIEPQRAGTGGAVWHARDRLEDWFFLLNGDLWFDINLLELSRRVIGEASVTGAIAIRALQDASRYGVVELDRDRITRFRARPERPGNGLVSGGVYFFRRTLIDGLGPRCSLEEDVLPRLASDEQLLGVPFEKYFIDIGVPQSLARAQGLQADRAPRAGTAAGREGQSRISRQPIVQRAHAKSGSPASRAAAKFFHGRHQRKPAFRRVGAGRGEPVILA